MKVENDVTAINDGIIKEIKVAKGDNVANKDVLFIIG
jgi:biotin carboxyl carrier protein